MADDDIHITGGTVLDGICVPLLAGDPWIEDGERTRVTPGKVLRHGRA